MLICLDEDNHIKQRLGGSFYSAGFTLRGTFEAVRVTCGDSTVFSRLELVYEGSNGALTVVIGDAPRGLGAALRDAYSEARAWPHGLALTFSAVDGDASLVLAAPLALGHVDAAPIAFTVGRVARDAIDVFIKGQVEETQRHKARGIAAATAHERARIAGDYGALVSG